MAACIANALINAKHSVRWLHAAQIVEMSGFFNENEYLLIQHEKGRRIYHIAAIKRIVTDYEHMVVDTTLKTHVQHIDKLLADSTHKRDLTYDKDTNILVLQTCTREKKVNAYYILIAFEVNE
jgi:hypothetical protein